MRAYKKDSSATNLQTGGTQSDDGKVKARQAADLVKAAQTLIKKAQNQADFEHIISILTDAITLRPNRAAYYFTRGRCFISMGQFQRALFDFSMAIRLESTVAKYYGSRGYCFRKLGRIQEALKDYNDAVRYEKENPEYYFSRALVYFDLEDFQTAINDFSQALDKRLSAPFKAFFHRGMCYRRVKRLDESLKDLKHALSLDNSHAEAHNQLGLSLCEAKDYQTASSEFTSALELLHETQPSDVALTAKYHSNRGLALDKMGQHHLALDDFTAAIERDDTEPHYFFNRGNCQYALKAFDAAIEDYSAAVKLDPKKAVYWHHIGLGYQALEQIERAIQYFQKALEKDTAHHPSRFHMGLMYHRGKEYDKALEAFAEVPATEALYEARGKVYCDMNTQDAYQKAYDDFHLAISVKPLNALHYYNRGTVLHLMKRHQDALQDFNKALILGEGGQLPTEEPAERDERAEAVEEERERERAPSVVAKEDKDKEKEKEREKVPTLSNRELARIYSDRGLAWRALGNLPQAVEDLTVAVAKCGPLVSEDGTPPSPEVTEYLATRAQCFFEQGLYDRGEMDLTTALGVSPSDPHLSYKRGLTRYAQGEHRYVHVIMDLKRAIANNLAAPHQADLYYHMGLAYANLGKHPLAVPCFDAAVKRSGDKPHYMHERAKSLQVVGDHLHALEDFTRVLEVQPRNARALFRRAFSYKALKAYEEAADDFESAKEYEPSDPRLVVNYRQVHHVRCIVLGPAGHEDPSTAMQHQQDDSKGVGVGQYGGAQLVTTAA
ncbi:unnamed protein product [Vitrella brassicaformis CCMP3155]|uniref:Uncharacterized protein n=3 Tax=Vitrella brassicaformis TaxID=1169539 RepID=A0A0G4EQ84_VITBC|nr:unnamed protein product [Vitrella brassicaformis CCMP3155]|eukprot:CEL99774.1 unnamed protein product [Vitrella brassicaformis CCMP3155]